jgi:hypothetical protein
VEQLPKAPEWVAGAGPRLTEWPSCARLDRHRIVCCHSSTPVRDSPFFTALAGTFTVGARLGETSLSLIL